MVVALRVLFALMLLAGLVLGAVYPWAVYNISGYEIGSWRLYEPDTGLRSAEAMLAPSDAPVRVLVDLTTRGTFSPAAARTVLVLRARTEGRTVLERRLTFVDSNPQSTSPQGTTQIYRAEAGLIDPVDGDAYRFAVAFGENGGATVAAVDLVLRASAFELDPRVPPVGYVLIAVGFVGFVLALRRRRRKPAAAPPPRRWGRGG